MKQFAFSIFLSMIFISCNNGKADKKDEIVKTDSLTREIKDVAPVVDPAINNTPTPGPKCFQQEAGNYSTIINMVFFSPTECSGSFAINENGKKLADKQRFYGTKNGNEFTIKFMTRLPKAGDIYELSDKPWTLKNTIGSETLTVLIKTRKSNTDQWTETPVEFKACSPGTK